MNVEKNMISARNQQKLNIISNIAKINTQKTSNIFGGNYQCRGEPEPEINNRLTNVNKCFYAVNKILIRKKKVSMRPKTEIFNGVTFLF